MSPVLQVSQLERCMNFPCVSVTFSAHHILFDLISRTLCGKEYNFEAAQYAVFSIVTRNFR